MPFAELFLNLGFDILLRVQQLQLTLHMYQDSPESLLYTSSFEERLSVGRIDIEMASYEVSEPPGIFDPFERM